MLEDLKSCGHKGKALSVLPLGISGSYLCIFFNFIMNYVCR